MSGKRKLKTIKRRSRKNKQTNRVINHFKEKIEYASKFPLTRNLLDCEKCNLVEDKSFGRPVFTRFLLPDEDYGKPTDMLFKEIGKNEFECPNCQNIVNAEPLDNDDDMDETGD